MTTPAAIAPATDPTRVALAALATTHRRIDDVDDVNRATITVTSPGDATQSITVDAYDLTETAAGLWATVVRSSSTHQLFARRVFYPWPSIRSLTVLEVEQWTIDGPRPDDLPGDNGDPF